MVKIKADLDDDGVDDLAVTIPDFVVTGIKMKILITILSAAGIMVTGISVL